MRKSFFVLIASGTLALSMTTACTDDSEEVVASEPAKNSSVTAKEAAARQRVTPNTAQPAESTQAIMDQPVDFSTPENVAKTLKNIRETAGPQMARKVESKMGYLLTYDLSVGHNEAKLHKALNGKTPNEIIAMKKR